MVTFGVLGPLVAVDEHGSVDLKGPRHRAVLARLLVARGAIVPVRRLVDDLWDDPPEAAVGAVQTFVAALRRAIEPDRPPRSPARVLVTEAPGYALRATADAVDAWRFDTTVAVARDLLAAGQAYAARAELDEALALGRGPAYAEFADEPWARGEISRLSELRLLAVESRAAANLMLGRAGEVVPDLETHVLEHPWREDAWRLLALALYRTGRQADALALLRRARAALISELGIDLGPALRELETDILAQAPHLTALNEQNQPNTGVHVGRSTRQPVLDNAGETRRLVGRMAELAQLETVADAIAVRRELGLVLVSGAAGAGKTALVAALAERLAGWTLARGRSPDDEGVPALWPWTEILNSLADQRRGWINPVPAAAPGPPINPAARFHMHRAVASYLATTAEQAPLLLVLDDLHWADADTLALMTYMVTEPAPGPVLIAGTYRINEISPALADALGRWARAEPVRIYLDGLSEQAVHELVCATIGYEVPSATTRLLYQRSGGNPFFVRELARALDTEGETALSSVPAGVREIIRHRLAALPDAQRTVLHQAAVIGRDIELDLLMPLSSDEELVLTAMESALLMGFVVENGADRLRFEHDLVRETLYQDVARPRRARWHARVAETLEGLRPNDIEALAHHFLRAESRSTAARAAGYSRSAAEQAEQRFAPHVAARLWQDAITAQDRTGIDDPRARLELVVGLARTLAVTGQLKSTRRHMLAAITAARGLDDPELTARLIGAYDVPAIWTTSDDPALAAHVVAIAEQTLAALPEERAELPEELAELRCRLLSTIALELRGTVSDRGRAAAREAEAIARELGDPSLLAYALNARFMQEFEHAGMAAQRARIGTELVELAARHRLVAFEVLGHLILLQSHCALVDFDAADVHADAVDRLAEQFEIPLVGIFTRWYAALRAVVGGRLAEAEAAIGTATIAVGAAEMPGLEHGLRALSLLCLRIQQGSPLDPDEPMDWGPYRRWTEPLVLLAAGRRTDAEAAAEAIPDAPRDLLYEARLCLAARTALAVDDRGAAERIYRALLPAAAELAGAGSGVLTLGPVACYLGELATYLGSPDDAERHYRQALEIAAKAEAPQWLDAAKDALQRLDPDS